MENRQRTIRKLLWRITAVLAVLAVVSICFVSGTFARYVSNRSGSTVTKVAKWDIDFTDADGSDAVENNFTVTVGKLSPSKAESPTQAENGEVVNRVKYSGTVLALKITNSGDVDAYLTITGADNTDVYGTNLIYYGTYNETAGGSNAYKKNSGSAEEGKLVWGTDGFADDGTPSAEEAEAVITMQFALTNTDGQPGESAWKSYADFLSAYSQPSTIPGTDDNSLRWLAAKDGETVETLYVWVRAVWTSQDQKGEDYADTLDTWFGEHIAAVGAEFSFSVVQASELPT